MLRTWTDNSLEPLQQVVKRVWNYKIKCVLKPQNDGFSLLGFVVFIALFILDAEIESPKTSEVRNPKLFFLISHFYISALLS